MTVAEVDALLAEAKRWSETESEWYHSNCIDLIERLAGAVEAFRDGGITSL